jgi:hypothetical protein
VIGRHQGIPVLGNGNVDIGSKTPGRESGRRGLRTKPAPQQTGAMSQQRGDGGNGSAPQELVQLVGCRDPRARRRPWVRPVPPKRQ